MTLSLFKEKYGIKLTDQQEAAVLRTEGHTLLLAVPGSGKTTVIVSRIGYMTECCGIPHESILTLTYSVAACRDMKERYISFFGSSNVPQFRTIHGICALIIIEYEKLYKKKAFRLIEGEMSENSLLLETYREVYGKTPDTGSITELKRHICYARNMMMSDDEAKDYSEDGLLDVVLEKYRKLKILHSVMDYDDQLEFAYKILRNYPTILDTFRERFRYINVDEAQDTSKLQHEIIRLMADKNLFMVGDEDQSIYGFRAAYPSGLMEFDKIYPNSLVLLMEQNFRSTKNIVKRAKKLIENNRERRQKNMFTENVSGSDIKIDKVSGYSDQFPRLLKICSQVPGTNEKTAILFRNNESAVPIIDMLEKNGIPYRCRENDCMYFTNPAVCDMLTMLRLCENPDDGEAFLNIAPKLGCGLTAETAKHIYNSSKKNNRSITTEFQRYIITKTNKEKQTEELFNVISKYSRSSLSGTIKRLHTATCFGRFLDHRFKDRLKIAVLSRLAEDCEDLGTLLYKLSFLHEKLLHGNTPSENCVILSTIHSSKGLEYDNVYLIDVKDGILPAEPRTRNELKNQISFFEEERRLFYVGITRAKKNAVILRYCSEYDGTSAEGSSFIRDLMNEKISIFGISGKSPLKINIREKTSADYSRYSKGTTVIHSTFGKGKILDTSDGISRVLFQDKNVRSISLDICIKNGILKIQKD